MGEERRSDGSTAAGDQATPGEDRRITRLHDVAADLQSVSSKADVYDAVVDAAVEIVGFDWCALLVPVEGRFEVRRVSPATPAEAGERPLRVDEGVAGETYQRRESIIVVDESEHELASPTVDTFASGISVPLDGWSVLQGGSSTVGAFDESDREAAELLAGHACGALDRIERERDLAQYETVAEAVNDLVYAVDEDGYFQFVNESQEAMTGYSREELLGEHVSVLMEEDSRAKARERIETLRESETRSVTFERTAVTADGEEIYCEDHMALLPAEDGEFRGTAGIVRDITDHKERQRQFRKKNDRLEQFASIVSHDLRNPLDVVKGRLSHLQYELDSEHVDVAMESARRMEVLISELLALTRGDELVSDVDTVALVDLATTSWTHVETADARLNVEGDLVIRADASRTQELLGNLFRNALDHGPSDPGNELTITVGGLPDERGFFVADDGRGIPADEREKVFSAGFTSSGTGTGFGLAIVEGIVDAHGWEVAATESAAGGARFEFTGVDVVDR
jgi:PAS domain S-box-containing protein